LKETLAKVVFLETKPTNVISKIVGGLVVAKICKMVLETYVLQLCSKGLKKRLEEGIIKM
jgi:hypothetical protein